MRVFCCTWTSGFSYLHVCSALRRLFIEVRDWLFVTRATTSERHLYTVIVNALTTSSISSSWDLLIYDVALEVSALIMSEDLATGSPLSFVKKALWCCRSMMQFFFVISFCLCVTVIYTQEEPEGIDDEGGEAEGKCRSFTAITRWTIW